MGYDWDALVLQEFNTLDYTYVAILKDSGHLVAAAACDDGVWGSGIVVHRRHALAVEEPVRNFHPRHIWVHATLNNQPFLLSSVYLPVGGSLDMYKCINIH